jgi:hypothetical protein
MSAAAEDQGREYDESTPYDSEEELFDALPNTFEEADERREAAEEQELWRKEKERQEALRLKKAQSLIAAPELLARALDMCSQLGVVGEESNLLILTLAGVSRTLPRPASVMLRGSPSSGKSSTMNAVLQLFDPKIVMERAGISGKALFHGEGQLASKILTLPEYHAGKDARHLIRLAQTEGVLTDETTVVEGRWRSTAITKRNRKASRHDHHQRIESRSR